MKALALPGLASDLDATAAKAKATKSRGVSAARRKSAPAAPAVRRSTRSAGMDADMQQYAGGVASEERGGKIVLSKYDGPWLHPSEREQHPREEAAPAPALLGMPPAVAPACVGAYARDVLVPSCAQTCMSCKRPCNFKILWTFA